LKKQPLQLKSQSTNLRYKSIITKDWLRNQCQHSMRYKETTKKQLLECFLIIYTIEKLEIKKWKNVEVIEKNDSPTSSTTLPHPLAKGNLMCIIVTFGYNHFSTTIVEYVT